MSLYCQHLIKLVMSLVVIYNTLQRKPFHFQRTLSQKKLRDLRTNLPSLFLFLMIPNLLLLPKLP